MKLAVAIAGLLVCLPSVAFAGTVTNEQHGDRNVRIFVPTTPKSPAPLVVMLHGCTQTPDGFAEATQMDALAEQEGFVVAYPEEPTAVVATKCFQWYLPAHQSRGAGEPMELSDATNEIIAAHGIDPERVYVAGISAGAAMSVILGATYPDVYTAVGVVAGLEYKAASSVGEGVTATQSGGPDPATEGAAAYAAMGAFARVVPILNFQGTADGVVNKVNGDQVVAQWLATNEAALGAGMIADPVSATGTAGYAYTHYIYAAKSNGASVIEQYAVTDLGHAWPGGKAGGSYSDPKGPDATTLLWAFFSGRTRSAPLDVAPPALTPDGGSSGGGTSSSSSSSSSSTSSGGSTDADGGSSGDSPASDSGGCSSAPGSAGSGLLAALSLAALAIVRKRR